MDLVFPAWAPGNHKSLLEALPVMAAQGVTRVEWSLGNPDYFDAKDATQVAVVCQTLADTRAVALHAPFGDRPIWQPDLGPGTIACYLTPSTSRGEWGHATWSTPDMGRVTTAWRSGFSWRGKACAFWSQWPEWRASCLRWRICRLVTREARQESS